MMEDNLGHTYQCFITRDTMRPSSRYSQGIPRNNDGESGLGHFISLGAVALGFDSQLS